MASVIGIDEVGRGPIAGPVAVGAFLMDAEALAERIMSFSVPLRDSKQLTKAQREAWYAHLEKLRDEGHCDFAIAMVSAGDVDTKGISAAIRKALAETLDMLEAGKEMLILLDGSLHAPAEYKNQMTIIKGDEKEMAISLASIVAKVTRDRHMEKLGERYPQYGFDQHSGYGTEAHYAAIKKHGLTPVHRKSFLMSLPEVRGNRRLVNRMHQKRKTKR